MCPEQNYLNWPTEYCQIQGWIDTLYIYCMYAYSDNSIFVLDLKQAVGPGVLQTFSICAVKQYRTGQYPGITYIHSIPEH